MSKHEEVLGSVVQISKSSHIIDSDPAPSGYSDFNWELEVETRAHRDIVTVEKEIEATRHHLNKLERRKAKIARIIQALQEPVI